MRTSTTQLLDDGMPSKRALVLDLLLAQSDGTPLLTELKIKKDTHPVCALVQALAAAAHPVTPAQRNRLENCYSEKVALPRAGLLRLRSVASLIRQIYFLVPDDLEQRSIVLRCL